MAKAIKRKEESGNRYGMLLVVEFSHIKRSSQKSSKAFWRCACDCGAYVVVSGDVLRRGTQKSCGCKRSANFAQINEERMANAFAAKHSRANNIWRKIISRCTNESDIAFPRYGARGVEVCERWLSFANFLEDMGDPLPGMTIDRIDNEAGYAPDNCRWADRKTQSRNRRTTKLTFDDAQEIRRRLIGGESKSVLADEYAVSRQSIDKIEKNETWVSSSYIQAANSSTLFEFRRSEMRVSTSEMARAA